MQTNLALGQLTMLCPELYSSVSPHIFAVIPPRYPIGQSPIGVYWYLYVEAASEYSY